MAAQALHEGLWQAVRQVRFGGKRYPIGQEGQDGFKSLLGPGGGLGEDRGKGMQQNFLLLVAKEELPAQDEHRQPLLSAYCVVRRRPRQRHPHEQRLGQRGIHDRQGWRDHAVDVLQAFHHLRRCRRVLPEAHGQAGNAHLFAEQFPLAQRPPKPFQQREGLGGRPGRFQLLEELCCLCLNGAAEAEQRHQERQRNPRALHGPPPRIA